MAVGQLLSLHDDALGSVVLALLPVLNDSVVVNVAQPELVADIGLKADVVVDNVVQAVKQGQGQLQVFPCIAIIRAI